MHEEKPTEKAVNYLIGQGKRQTGGAAFHQRAKKAGNEENTRMLFEVFGALGTRLTAQRLHQGQNI